MTLTKRQSGTDRSSLISPEDPCQEAAAADDDDEELSTFPPPNVTLPKWTTIYMEPLTVLFCLAFQGIGPLISQYVYHRISSELGFNGTTGGTSPSMTAGDSLCNASDRHTNGGVGNSSAQFALTQLVQDRTSTWILHRDVLAAAGALISIPILSSSSDRLGRRVALVLPCLGTLVESVVSLCVVWLHLPLTCMLIAAGLSGLCGGIGCLFSGALAYLADITPLRSRPMRITVLEALTGVGGAAACVAVGWWIRWQGYLIPHVFLTLVYLVTAAFCLFVVPEVRTAAAAAPSTDQQHQRSSALGRLLVDTFRDFVSLMKRPHSLPTVYILVLCGLAVYCAAFYGTTDLTVLYSMNYPFCLDSVLIGYFSAGKQTALQIGMLLTVGLCRRLGLSTLTIASIGAVSTAAGDILLARAADRSILWLSIAASAAASCPVPMYRAFVSMVTPADKQGCMFSVFGVLQMLFYLFGNLAFTYGYKATLMWQPGFVFYTVAATLCVGFALTVAAEVVYRVRTLPGAGKAPSIAEVSYGDGSDTADEVAVAGDNIGSVQWNHEA